MLRPLISLSKMIISSVAKRFNTANPKNVQPIPKASITLLVANAKIRINVKRVKLAQDTPASCVISAT